MKRFLSALALSTSVFFGIAVTIPATVVSQYGYSSQLSGDGTIVGDNIFLGFGDSDDWQIEFISANDELRIQHSGGTNVVLFDVPVAAASQNYLSLTATALIANGSETVAGVDINIINANHTGTGNTLNLLSFAALTGDANSNLNGILIGALTGTTGADTPPETEYAINIGAGWDSDIEFKTQATFTIDGLDLGAWKVATGTLTATQVRKLNGTQVEAIAAPGNGKSIVVESFQVMLDYGGTIYDSIGAGEDLTLVYDVANTRAQVGDCDASTNCLDPAATADDFALVRGYQFSDNASRLESNDAVNWQILSGEWASTDDDTDGNSPIHYLIRYRIVATDITP